MDFRKSVLPPWQIVIGALFTISSYFVSMSYGADDDGNVQITQKPNEIQSTAEITYSDLQRPPVNQDGIGGVKNTQKSQKNQKILNELYKNIRLYESGVFNYEKKVN